MCDRLLDDSSVEFQKIEFMIQNQCLSDINNLGHTIDATNLLKGRRSWRRINPDDIPIRGFHSAVVHEDLAEMEGCGEVPICQPDNAGDHIMQDIAVQDNTMCDDAVYNVDQSDEVCENSSLDFQDPLTISLSSLPCDLILRVMAMLSPRERFLLCVVSKLLNALFCEPALWRHINLTSCSACVTDAAVETMLAITDHLEALVIRPIAPPPFLSWRFLQALAAHPCARSLTVLIVHNCEGLLCNTPR